MLWQQTEVAGLRKNVQGYKLGPTFDTNFVATGDASRRTRERPVRCRSRSVGSETQDGSGRSASSVAMGRAALLVIAAITFLGLLAVTFFIGRVIPIDPVLAIVGDRAPQAWSRRRARNTASTCRSGSSSSSM